MDKRDPVPPSTPGDDNGQIVDIRSICGPGYAREWALFRDYTAATRQPTLPTTVETLTRFLTQVPTRASTRGRRVAAIAAAHRNAGHLLARPVHRPARLDDRPEPGELLAACPTRGWPEGLSGRRDGFLIVLTHVLGYSHTHARHIQPAALNCDPEHTWHVEQRLVPINSDPRQCPRCAVARWVDILGIADGLGRGSARMHLVTVQAATAKDTHHHTSTPPHRWRHAAQLLPAIDRHGWIDDYQPLSTRAIHTRLTYATTRARTGNADTQPATATTSTDISTATFSRQRGQPLSPRAPLRLDEVLTQLDQVAHDADALNARIEALLAGHDRD